MLNDDSEISSHLSFLDSGSDITFISFDLAAALNLKLNPSKDLVHVGNSSELQVNYESSVKLVNGDEVFDVKVGILSTELMLGINYAHVLIGNDVLRLCGSHAVDYGAMVVHLGQVKYYAILATKENAPEIEVVAKRYLRVNQSIACNEVNDFMTKHKLAFTQDSSDLGTLPYEVVDLNFKKDVSLPKICRYTNPPHVQAAINVEVNNLIANGVLEKCNTPKFISNLIVSIRKKDNSGSDITFISFDLAAALNLKLNPSKDLVHVGNSSELQVNYESSVKLVNGDEVFDVKVGILSTELMLGINYAHVLIGNDVFRLCGSHAVDYGAMVVHLGQVKYYAILATKENAPEIEVVAKRYLRVNQSIACNEVNDFMTKHKLAFTQDFSDLGTLPYEVVDLNFKKDVSLPKICRYTNPPHVQAAIDVEVNNLIANGVLEKCNTPKFISNLIVSIRKKDSKKRVCADLRSLNSCIERIPTYLASPETIIAELSSAKWFAKFDLCSGYHHIKLVPEIRDYFAMFTSKGLYRFTRLPFGFVNSTVYFQYGMNAALSDVHEKYALRDDYDAGLIVYVDDLLAYASTRQLLHQLIEDTLIAFESCGAKLKSSKCTFFSNEISFLSYFISDGTVVPQKECLVSITQYKIPASVSQLRRWLGMIGYFAKHVENLQLILIPISKLLKRNVEFNFDDECIKAFDKVNTILSSSPVLLIADPKKEYFLEVDSSLVGMGAVLMQMNDTGKLQRVSYYSKRFNPTIKAPSVSALELRGIIFALCHYRHVVNRVTIITDHKPLIGFIQHGKSPELFKYLAFIESSGIELKYQNGKLMYGSDALSKQYNRFKKIGMEELTEPGHRDNKLSLEDEKKLLDQLHNVLCHLGSAKATNLLKKYNDEIPDVAKKYKDICDRCSTCQKVNQHLSVYGYLRVNAKYPLKSVTIDIKGPVIESEEGYRYIFGCIDTYSRFVWFKPLFSTSSSESITALKEFIYLYGAPSIVRMDNAQTFASSKFSSEMKLLKIDIKYGLPYYSNSQTLIERTFGTLNRILTKIRLDTKHVDWAKELQRIAFILNSMNKDENSAYTKFMLLPDERQCRVDRRLEQLVHGCMIDEKNDEISRKRGTKINVGDLIRIKKKLSKKGSAVY
uniref:RNA-directed DNA polymerase n=1 Tax=Strongyloides venezuelensis TaxID=75913 RepID=A0A0K0FR94_STRVS